jgi:hypothetical protein
MLRAIARWWAKLSYRWELEVWAARSDVNADLAARNAKEKRALVEQLKRQADDIETC